MDKNCLVTRLRAIVLDYDLEFLDDDSIRFKLSTPNEYVKPDNSPVPAYADYDGYKMYYFITSGPVELIITGVNIKGVATGNSVTDAYVEINNLTVNITRACRGSLIFDSTNISEVLVIVKNLESFEHFQYILSTDINLNAICGNNLTHLLLYNYTKNFSLSDICFGNYDELEQFSASNKPNLTGDISSIAECNSQKLTSIDLNSCHKITGNITDLAKFKNLIYLNLTDSNTLGNLYNFMLEFAKNLSNSASGQIIIGYNLGKDSTYGNGDNRNISVVPNGELNPETRVSKAIRWSRSGNTFTYQVWQYDGLDITNKSFTNSISFTVND